MTTTDEDVATICVDGEERYLTAMTDPFGQETCPVLTGRELAILVVAVDAAQRIGRGQSAALSQESSGHPAGLLADLEDVRERLVAAWREADEPRDARAVRLSAGERDALDYAVEEGVRKLAEERSGLPAGVVRRVEDALANVFGRRGETPAARDVEQASESV